MSEVNELPQMCFPHGVSTSTLTLTIEIYSLKKCAGPLECWLTTKHKCRPQSHILRGASSATLISSSFLKFKVRGREIKKDRNVYAFPRDFLIFFLFVLSRSFCLSHSSCSLSLSLCLCSVSLTLSVPEASAWWQL